jgi:hypothetical protein
MPSPSLAALLAACCLAAAVAGRPHYPDHPDRAQLASPTDVLAADDRPLGTVTVTLVPTGTDDSLRDDEALRAAVLSGMAVATDWLSVGDATAVLAFVGDAGAAAAANVSAAAAAAAESAACDEEGGSVTYIIPLAPAVAPTADQARQLTEGVTKSLEDHFRRMGVPARVAQARVALDEAHFAARPAPFPANARSGSSNVMLGWVRGTGYGMDLCPPGVGLAAIRAFTQAALVTSKEGVEAAAANGTSSKRGLPTPMRTENLANTRVGEKGEEGGQRGRGGEGPKNAARCFNLRTPFYSPSVRVAPKDDFVDTPDIVLDAAGRAGGEVPDVLDMRIAVAGLTRGQAFATMNAIQASSRSGKMSRELSSTPGLDGASVGTTPDFW